MPRHRPLDAAGVTLGPREIALGVLGVVTVSVTVVAQLVWLVVAGATGLATALPAVAVDTLLPAASLALPPGLLARAWFGSRRAVTVGGAVFAASAVVSTVTKQFVLCAGC